MDLDESWRSGPSDVQCAERRAKQIIIRCGATPKVVKGGEVDRVENCRQARCQMIVIHKNKSKPSDAQHAERRAKLKGCKVEAATKGVKIGEKTTIHTRRIS